MRSLGCGCVDGEAKKATDGALSEPLAVRRIPTFRNQVGKKEAAKESEAGTCGE